ncbi:hypothetical protein ACR78H_25130 [Sphingobacterium siyangense]|uniref:hypothetical protein n=1 Tax=Sphingobacterium siyangense TaxID=459529 RepID=UPI003DA61E3F
MKRLTLPSPACSQAIKQARHDCTAVMGFFIKYDVIVHDSYLLYEVKNGFEEDPRDIFALGYFIREYV